jgi:hypothetical protein
MKQEQEVMAAFKCSLEYEYLKNRTRSWERVENMPEYDEQFVKFAKAYVGAIDETIMRRYVFAGNERYAAAAADLLTYAPWSLRDESGTIVVSGRYFVGHDQSVTILTIEAKPEAVRHMVVGSDRYIIHRYVITSIRTDTDERYTQCWQAIKAIRKSVVERPEPIPEQPTAATRI